jgi:hypothetical protein
MRSSTLALTALLLAGCAGTEPTPYQKEKKQEGFRDEAVDGLRVSRFRANPETKRKKTLRYAEFRAIEYCREKEGTHANIIDTIDRTVEKEVTRTSGSGWGPTYGFGMYPYYSRYSSIGIGAGWNTISSNSWNETLTFPWIEVYYTCADRIVRPELLLRELRAEDVKHLVKDVKGVLQIEKFLDGSLNQGPFEPGDLILRADGQRIEKIFELVRRFSAATPEVAVQVLRDGERRSLRMRSKDVTAAVAAVEEKIIRSVCKGKEKDEEKLLKKSRICR